MEPILHALGVCHCASLHMDMADLVTSGHIFWPSVSMATSYVIAKIKSLTGCGNRPPVLPTLRHGELCHKQELLELSSPASGALA